MVSYTLATVCPSIHTERHACVARPRVAHATSDCSRCTVTYAPPMTFTRTVTATVTVLPERKRLSSLLQLHAFNLRQEGATDMTTTMDTVTTTAIDTLP